MSTTAPLTTDRRWGGVDGLYGGYVVGLLVDTAVAASSYRLASLSANFVSRVSGDEVRIGLERAHSGRSTELLRLGLQQGGRDRVFATAELLRLPADEPTPTTWVRPSDPRGPHDRPGDLGRARQPFDDLIELRRTPPLGMASETSSWARLRPMIGDSGLRSAEAVLVALLDTPTPALFGSADPPDFVPSIDFTVHFAPRAGWMPSEWVRLDHVTGWATRHHCCDEVTAWTVEGRLLASVRQTRGVRYGSAKG